MGSAVSKPREIRRFLTPPSWIGIALQRQIVVVGQPLIQFALGYEAVAKIETGAPKQIGNLMESKVDRAGERFSNMDLSNTCFENCNLSGADFDDAKLHNVIFRDCDLYWARFFRADATQAIFINCDLAGAVFDETIFTKAYFIRCDLGKDSLGGMIDMSSTVTEGAVFLECDLGGVVTVK